MKMKDTVTAKHADPSDPSAYELDGLFLSGVVRSRSRRMFTREGKPPRYIITLSMLTQDGMHKATRWCDNPAPADLPPANQHCCLKVRIVTYSRANGEVGYRLTWGNDDHEEEF